MHDIAPCEVARAGTGTTQRNACLCGHIASSQVCALRSCVCSAMAGGGSRVHRPRMDATLAAPRSTVGHARHPPRPQGQQSPACPLQRLWVVLAALLCYPCVPLESVARAKNHHPSRPAASDVPPAATAGRPRRVVWCVGLRVQELWYSPQTREPLAADTVPYARQSRRRCSVDTPGLSTDAARCGSNSWAAAGAMTDHRPGPAQAAAVCGHPLLTIRLLLPPLRTRKLGELARLPRPTVRASHAPSCVSANAAPTAAARHALRLSGGSPCTCRRCMPAGAAALRHLHLRLRPLQPPSP